MSHTPKEVPCGNAAYGCDNALVTEAERDDGRCDACVQAGLAEMARQERAYRVEKQPKSGFCARCGDNAVADEDGLSECCGAKVLDGSDLVDQAESLLEDR